ncbi:uncharacterized protein LOC121878809 [Homarus americanus]|nr:uncharacterized protein LOC121878809 [Homarus americanus]
MMSVRHIDYLKIYPSKLLVVEIRPVRCVIDTPSGPSRTAKWMNYSHWKELQTLLNDAVDQYQEEKNNLSVTQDIECNKPIIKVGSTIKIGYMFTNFRKHSCHYLTPRDDCAWTDDEGDEDVGLKDKGGRYESYMPCGEMLVVSVTLLTLPSSSEQGSQDTSKKRILYSEEGSQDTRSVLSPTRYDRQLLKALDKSMVFTNTISDYFEVSQQLPAEPTSSKKNSSSSSVQPGSIKHRTLKKM